MFGGRSKRSPKASAPPKSKTKTARSATGRNSGAGFISIEEFQSRIARAVPRLSEIGLRQDQIEQVLEIIRELVAT